MKVRLILTGWQARVALWIKDGRERREVKRYAAELRVYCRNLGISDEHDMIHYYATAQRMEFDAVPGDRCRV